MKSRLIIGKKKIEEGVYIQHKNGTLYNPIKWNTSWNADANGVAVIGANRVVIAKIASTWSYPWSSNTSTVVKDIVTSESAIIARMDYSGSFNTNAIITQLSDCPAAKYCHNYIFPNGKRGYLPSLAELETATKQYHDIDQAMTLIGGNILGASQGGGKPVDTSTQYDASRRWTKGWGPYSFSFGNKNNAVEVRPFTSL